MGNSIDKLNYFSKKKIINSKITTVNITNPRHPCHFVYFKCFNKVFFHFHITMFFFVNNGKTIVMMMVIIFIFEMIMMLLMAASLSVPIFFLFILAFLFQCIVQFLLCVFFLSLLKMIVIKNRIEKIFQVNSKSIEAKFRVSFSSSFRLFLS